MTVFVIEDDEDIRETVVECLRDHGYSAHAAAGGAEAFETLAGLEPKPALILLDLMMPDMSGAEFRERQLQDPSLAAIPVVVFSADANVKAKAAGLDAHGYLHKPLKLQTLLDVVAQFVGRTAAR